MNRIYILLSLVLACLLLGGCDKDEIVRAPIDWTWDILTPESVKCEGGSAGWAPAIYFKADSREGDVVITCSNYHDLGLGKDFRDSYDCGWASLSTEGNRVIIHFPRYDSHMATVSEDIILTGRDGKTKARATIGLTRSFGTESRLVSGGQCDIH